MDEFLRMLSSAQGGKGMEALARAYGLSLQQAQSAAEAMIPAFAEGFRHATQSPEAMGFLMSLMANGPYGALYVQPAAPSELSRAGQTALEAVFGSGEVSRAVANQVAASTGLGVAVVRQMMPSYAALMVGGLSRSLAASGALQQMLAAMLSRMPGAEPPRAAPPSTGNPWIDAFLAFAAPEPRMPSTGNPWADAFARSMMQYAPSAAPARSAGNAWQEVVNAMASTMAQVGSPAPSAARPAAAAGTSLPFQDYFAQMFAQGFPPRFPGVDEEPPRYAFPDYWLEMMTPSSSAEPAPGGKPRQIDGPGGKREAASEPPPGAKPKDPGSSDK
ncbi:DUF937 domain-containing protein [Xanthobacter sp. KR7-225]|uniref:DUF937 domain-containing protein n=1 Tax=Xanthobacter sp. KR7-225 TaxID=3156613 RepID=UPI0032B3AE16